MPVNLFIELDQIIDEMISEGHDVDDFDDEIDMDDLDSELEEAVELFVEAVSSYSPERVVDKKFINSRKAGKKQASTGPQSVLDNFVAGLSKRAASLLGREGQKLSDEEFADLMKFASESRGIPGLPDQLTPESVVGWITSAIAMGIHDAISEWTAKKLAG